MSTPDAFIAIIAILLFILAAAFNDNRLGWVGLAVVTLLAFFK